MWQTKHREKEQFGDAILMSRGTRLAEVIESKNDPLYEDTRAMTLTFQQMADRCLNVEMTDIFKDKAEGDVDTLSYLLENGFKGYYNMTPSELIEEYNCMEDKWYQYYQDDELIYQTSGDDPIQKLEEEKV